jgi:copper chaperone
MPMIPPPTTATSTSGSRSSGGYPVGSDVAIHNDRRSATIVAYRRRGSLLIPPPGTVRNETRREEMETRAYSVPGMHCAHCESAVTEELSGVAGVAAVDVDLETKLVTVRGDGLDDAALMAAIDEAGYDAEPVPGR